VDRPLVVALRRDRHNFVRTMLRLGARARRGRGRRRPARLPDLRRPPRRGHARVVELPFGVYHVAADGDCTWADFAEAIFDGGGPRLPRAPDLDRRARRPGPRPAYSVLRSEKGAPTLPHWRDGLRECLEAIRAPVGENKSRGELLLPDHLGRRRPRVSAVWDAIYDSERWPEWWRGVQRSTSSRWRRRRRGCALRHVWRSVLPYPVRFACGTTRIELPDLIEGQADGELAGVRPLALLRRPADGRHLRVERPHDETVDESARAGRQADLRVESQRRSCTAAASDLRICSGRSYRAVT
jgi:hypothetical protein